VPVEVSAAGVAPAGRAVKAGTRAKNAEGDELEAPGPLRAGLVAAVFPFDGDSLDGPLRRLLALPDGEPGPAPPQPTPYATFFFAAATAVGEVVRRWKRRPVSLGSATGWKRRSTTMHGLS
jgi:hypothetical protein